MAACGQLYTSKCGWRDRVWWGGGGVQNYSRDIMAFIFLVLTLVAFATSMHQCKAPQLLNRQQTEEWKGWMQVLPSSPSIPVPPSFPPIPPPALLHPDARRPLSFSRTRSLSGVRSSIPSPPGLIPSHPPSNATPHTCADVRPSLCFPPLSYSVTQSACMNILMRRDLARVHTPLHALSVEKVCHGCCVWGSGQLGQDESRHKVDIRRLQCCKDGWRKHEVSPFVFSWGGGLTGEKRQPC